MAEVRKRVRLPHWDVENGIYFVTFNLFDALSAAEREKFDHERHFRIAELERLKERATAAELFAINRVLHDRAEECLDAGAGSCFMNDARIAAIVADAVMFFDEERYRLLSWCVMPNHVHAIFQIGDPVDRILFSWKSFTSKSANKLLGRTGAFWQEDYYDRSIRDSNELSRTVDYVLNNPVSAGQHDWPWVRSYPERL